METDSQNNLSFQKSIKSTDFDNTQFTIQNAHSGLIGSKPPLNVYKDNFEMKNSKRSSPSKLWVQEDNAKISEMLSFDKDKEYG